MLPLIGLAASVSLVHQIAMNESLGQSAKRVSSSVQKLLPQGGYERDAASREESTESKQSSAATDGDPVEREHEQWCLDMECTIQEITLCEWEYMEVTAHGTIIIRTIQSPRSKDKYSVGKHTSGYHQRLAEEQHGINLKDEEADGQTATQNETRSTSVDAMDFGIIEGMNASQ